MNATQPKSSAELSAASLDECFAGWRKSWKDAERSELSIQQAINEKVAELRGEIER